MRAILRMMGTALLALVLAGAANSKPPAPAAGALPPLIDRELFFGDPEISSETLSPDGRYVAFLKPWKNTRNIYVKAVNEPFSAAHLLTAETKRPIPGFGWTWDSKYIAYVKDHDGDENFNFYVVDPAAPTSAGSDAPPSRDMTGLKGVRVVFYGAPRYEPDIVYIGINDRDKAWHDLYRVRLSTGEKTLLHRNTERIVGWVFDLAGQLRLGFRKTEGGDIQILRVDGEKLTEIYSCTVFELCFPQRFDKDGKRVYMMSNKGTDNNLMALYLLDPATGATELVDRDRQAKVDLNGSVFSEATNTLALTTYRDTGGIRRQFQGQEFEPDYNWLRDQLAPEEFAVISRTADEQKWLVTAWGDTEPGRTLLLDRKTHTLTPQYTFKEELPRKALVKMKPVEYKSSDGLVIPAYLTLPAGLPAHHLPAIILPHGGPWGRDFWAYQALPQFLANRGYAVLQPNFRGSMGYGKKFLDAGNLEWGRRMQDDITWGVKYLVSQGIADPKRIGIMGGSYGGYATLAGVAFTPDLYAAAVDIVGPSNLVTLLETIPPYWEAERITFAKRMGDSSTADGKALLLARSPLLSADKIKTPLLVAQGANDPRVNRRESEQIVIALRDRGFPVEYILAPDEGHGFARPINNLALFTAAEKFFAQHLGGRYQEGGSPETLARLKEITVDPKTVVLAPPPTPAQP
jgi:dipeptidyl aminopeptidase/acylaminoacyl peptidase